MASSQAGQKTYASDSNSRPGSLISTDAPAELSAVVDELLNSLTTKFNSVSSQIFSKLDDMSKRLDNLEATLQANEQNKGSTAK